MLIFVCSPFRSRSFLGQKANYLKTLQHCRDVSDVGNIPISPVVIFSQFLDDRAPEERKRGITGGLELLKLCDEVWVFSEDITPGMAQEIRAAEMLGLPVRYKT